MTFLRKTFFLPRTAIEAQRGSSKQRCRDSEGWLIGELPRLCQWEKREKTSKTKDAVFICVFKTIFKTIFTVGFFATLKPSSETKAAGPWRHVGVTKALSSHVTVLRPFWKEGSSVDTPQEFSAYPDVGQAAVTYTDPWAAYEDWISTDIGQSLNQKSWLANVKAARLARLGDGDLVLHSFD